MVESFLVKLPQTVQKFYLVTELSLRAFALSHEARVSNQCVSNQSNQAVTTLNDGSTHFLWFDHTSFKLHVQESCKVKHCTNQHGIAFSRCIKSGHLNDTPKTNFQTRSTKITQQNTLVMCDPRATGESRLFLQMQSMEILRIIFLQGTVLDTEIMTRSPKKGSFLGVIRV